MGGKVAWTYLHWSNPWSKGSIRSEFVHRTHQSVQFRTRTSTKLLRNLYCENLKSSVKARKKACIASLDGFFNEDFSKQIQKLALKSHFSEDSVCKIRSRSNNNVLFDYGEDELDHVDSPWLRIRHDPLEWPEQDELIRENIELKVNSVDLPLSIRIIKRKLRLQEGLKEAGESVYCSINKAFSSMVFIVREIQSYTLKMHGISFYEDSQGILSRVQREIHASFVWLFQQVFSQTPTLMVSVMILLANFSVYSMTHNIAIAATHPENSCSSVTIETESDQIQQRLLKFDSPAIKAFSVSSMGGNIGGGGKIRPVANGADGSSLSQPSRTPATARETGAGEESEEEMKLWNSIVEESSRLQAELRDEALDHETMQHFVSPISVVVEPDDRTDCLRLELLYEMGLSQEPNNSTLLSNFAQFLYVVAHDHNRAEEYFRRAIVVEPVDAEALSRYATFLWVVRKDLEAAEDAYLEAIAADPGNPYHAANYANFVWSTGSKDICYPLSRPNDDTSSTSSYSNGA